MSRHLPWVLVQGLFFLAAAFPNADEWTYLGWKVILLVLLLAWIGYCLVRNVWRLVRAPAVEATTWTAMRLAVSGVLFLVIASGPLLEGRQLESRLNGLVWAALGAILLCLAARDVAPRRSQASFEPRDRTLLGG